jgi:integrase
MARKINRLNARAVATITKHGRHADGGGLYLSISPNGGRRWVFLFRWQSKPTEIGFGSARDVTLARARELAGQARAKLAEGINPKDIRRAKAGATFGECASRLIEAMRPAWKNDKHAAQWQMTVMGRAADKTSKTGWRAAEVDYCATLRALPVDKVTTSDVLAVLAPIWEDVPETASRLRGRIERVLAAAKAGGHRTGENPARWPDNLKELLPKRRKLTRGHHPAMSYSKVPAFMVDLRKRDAIAAAALEFTVLTAARSNETFAARWSDFELRAVPVTARDDEGKEFTVMGPCWTVQPEGMKGGRVHLVPLVPRVVELLKEMEEAGVGSPFVFPGQKASKPLSSMGMTMVLRRMKITGATVHGFRSSFRDWASETTHFPSEVVEMALAHVIKDETEAAYRRGVLFDKRRKLMEAWAGYCAAPKVGKVVAFRQDAKSA